MEGKTEEIGRETDRERLTIVGIANIIKTASAILNTSFFNRTVALRRLLWRDFGLK